MQTLKKSELRKYVPSAAAALLFTALLAQAPHAATVFIRIAPSDVQWEVWWLAVLGGVVYAIALESATAYFVWRNKMRWAIAFAAFSIMHNVAYYMPGAWTFDIAGAQLSLRYIVSALLISASLPIAIAAFSHVHVETLAAVKSTPVPEYLPAVPSEATTAPQKKNKGYGGAVSTVPAHPDATEAASEGVSVSPNHVEQTSQTDVLAPQPQAPSDVPTIDARTQALHLRDEGYTAAEIARMTGAKYSTVQSWLRRATVQTNGVNHA